MPNELLPAILLICCEKCLQSLQQRIWKLGGIPKGIVVRNAECI